MWWTQVSGKLARWTATAWPASWRFSASWTTRAKASAPVLTTSWLSTDSALPADLASSQLVVNEGGGVRGGE